MAENSNCPIDISSKVELPRSNSQYETRLYCVNLTEDWSPKDMVVDAPDSALSSMFNKGDKVVIKVFHDGPEEEKKANAKNRCENEYNRLRDLNDILATRKNKSWFKRINVVTVLGKGEDSRSPGEHIGGPFVIMELGECSLGHLLHHRKKDCPAQLEGNPDLLAEERQEENPDAYTTDHCFTYICQIFSAIDFIHKQGLMHRDLKSYNVLLFNNHTLCKLCDFEDCREVNTSHMTARMGTTWWRAPEMFQDAGEGNAQYGQSADWFSFALVICEALFREEPFECYYTGKMADCVLEASCVYDDKHLGALPGKYEVDSCAMYIDNMTHPGSPIVVLDKDKCVFPSVKGLPKVWTLINDLLSWDPKKRPEGDRLRKRFGSDIACHGTGCPLEIRFSEDGPTTDTGAKSRDTVRSYIPTNVLVCKVRINATQSDVVKECQEPIIKRLKEHAGDIHSLVETASKPKLEFKFKDDHLVLLIAGKKECVTKIYEFCSSDTSFVRCMAKWFENHSYANVRGIEFEVRNI